MGQSYTNDDGKAEQYNALNLGAGLRAETSPDFAVQAGFYKNSVRRNSQYIAADWTPLSFYGLKAGAFAGVVNGYPRFNEGGIAPAAGLSLRKPTDWGNVVIRFIPPCPKTVGVFAIEIGMRL